ncbi:DUF6515 family protein [Candidatus Auribacterota bacterium]
MKGNKIMNKRFLAAAVLCSVVIACSSEAFAGQKKAGRVPNNYAGRNVAPVKKGVFTLKIGGLNLFYSDGVFQKRGFQGYAMARPRVGTFVRRLPRATQVVFVTGRKYFTSGGVFYKRYRRGFLVVRAPVVKQRRGFVVRPVNHARLRTQYGW